jgi:hypothetical protein
MGLSARIDESKKDHLPRPSSFPFSLGAEMLKFAETFIGIKPQFPVLAAKRDEPATTAARDGLETDQCPSEVPVFWCSRCRSLYEADPADLRCPCGAKPGE